MENIYHIAFKNQGVKLISEKVLTAQNGRNSKAQYKTEIFLSTVITKPLSHVVIDETCFDNQFLNSGAFKKWTMWSEFTTTI